MNFKFSSEVKKSDLVNFLKVSLFPSEIRRTNPSDFRVRYSSATNLWLPGTV